MDGSGIFMGTALLWALSAVLVVPLANAAVARRLSAEGVAVGSLGAMPDERARWAGIATQYYILFDVMVLGTAGFIAGLMGYRFIGISLKAKGWPGMIAFMACSALGVSFATAAG